MANLYRAVRIQTPDWASIPAVTLHNQPWLAPCGIEAAAQLCHDGENLYVRMTAKEAHVRATLTGPLSQVCEDSCLEFFLAPRADDFRYFNFEWNRLCNAYVGFGGPRETRVRQILGDPRAVFAPTAFDTADGWGIAYRIPKTFIQLYMPGFELAGEAACNFYKCGDNTATPHYLAWADLTSDRPDYHRRQDFGRLMFE